MIFIFEGARAARPRSGRLLFSAGVSSLLQLTLYHKVKDRKHSFPFKTFFTWVCFAGRSAPAN
jgi:hypothetical protein